MGGSRYSSSFNTKKKLSTPFSRRGRDMSRFSFFFVIFFFGLFSVIIIMENFIPHWNINSLIEDNSEDDNNYAVADVDYEDFVDKLNEETGIGGRGRSSNKNSKSNKKFLGEMANLLSSSVINAVSEAHKNSSYHIQTDWQPVVGTKEKFFVYSAYYNYDANHVKIIGATRTRTTPRVKCRLYDNETRVIKTVDGTVRTIRENWNLKYSAVFVICNVGLRGSGDKSAEEGPRIRFVSVLAPGPSSAVSNLVVVKHGKSASPVDFSVCVKPIHFNYDKLLPLLEWIEFHRLMGVRHFTFFNRTVGPKVGCLLEQYGKDTVEILFWSLPFVSQKEIRTEGLFAALNDCVYRHRGRSKYLVLLDFDEIIMPRKTLNYSQFIEQLDTLSGKKKIGAYSVQNAFFYLQWPDDIGDFKVPGTPLAEKVAAQLLTLRKTRRRAKFHPHKQRSKYICDPEKVVEAGNHFVWEHTAGYNTLPVPPHLAALHHYRVCEFGGDQCTKSPSVVDKSAHVFGQLLAARVAMMLEKVADECNFNVEETLKTKTL